MRAPHEFTYSHYVETLREAADLGYYIIPFRDLDSHRAQKFIVLRHDVDLSLSSAVELAKVERKVSVSSTYFLMMHTQFYSIFGDPNSRVSQLLRLGHDLGYHYDVKYLPGQKRKKESLKAEVEFMETHFHAKVSALSQHNPSVDGYEPIELDGYHDAYSLAAQRGIKYLSDSVQRWREGCFCQHLGKHKRMQVLTHPEMWSKEGLPRKELLGRLRESSLSSSRRRFTWLERLHELYLANRAIPTELREFAP